MAKPDALQRYKNKRNFSVTSEPSEGGEANEAARSFVIQKHWASRLHYDFRLELDGTMKSWAVPKGPSYDPGDKRMAVHVEDHTISYNAFEGNIPAGQYGAGKVMIWDKGHWTPVGDPAKGYEKGKLEFELHGHKLLGRWVLLRMKDQRGKQDPWLLIKEKDEFAKKAMDFSVVDEMPDSVSGLDDSDRKAPAPAPVSHAADASRASTPAKQKGGRAATLPATFEPQLATLVDAPPPDAGAWLYEIKFDGYRVLARLEHGKIQLFTRNGNDWTHRLAGLKKELGDLPLPDGWYDGEIVVLDKKGLPSFQALQGAFDNSKTQNIVYYLFDLPFCDGRDLRALPLTERRKALETVLSGAGVSDQSLPGPESEERNAKAPHSHGHVRFSATFDVAGRDIIASACRLGLEGVIGKRKDAPYVSRRSRDWIKLKCSLRQEFVIGGYTDPKGTRSGIGSLLLGVHDESGKLQYAGNVGTGFNARMLEDIKAKLAALDSPERPFAKVTGMDSKAHWVKPVLLAEVSFAQWTDTGRIRHAVFHGLRTDKPAKSIVRETSMPIKKATAENDKRRSSARAKPGQGTEEHPATQSTLGALKVSHPDRVIDKASGTKKIDLVRYYALIGPLMMEHLKGRPVSIVRAPQGIKGPLFFQKHLETNTMAGVRQLSPELDPGHDPLMEIASPKGLPGAAQMNVIEFHTWNAIKTAISKPDRMTFDLDPGEGVEWPAVQEAALVIRSFLNQLEVVPFVKTSGGKGLHIVVPLQRRYDWDTVKDFSQAIVLHLAKTLPGRFTAKSGPKNRVGKIFIDYLRNGFGATTVAAWSARARPGMGISVPVAWDEVSKLHASAQWHIGNIHERLDVGNEPWSEYADSAKTLSAAMKALNFKKKAKKT